jgi:hypothetical protein
MSRMRHVLLGLCVALTIVGCGESNEPSTTDQSTTEQSTEPNCAPSTTGDPASSTTTLDPRCVVVATETSTTTAAAQEERWEGPVTGQTTQPGCEPPSLPVTGELSLVVQADGSVTGSVTERLDSFSCGGTATPAFEQTYQITGRKTSAAFELSVSGKEITLSIAGTQATTTLDNPGAGGYGATVTYTADCVTC